MAGINDIKKGEGFGIGGFGGLDEPFGSIGFEIPINPPSPARDIVLPTSRKGAAILGLKNSTYITNSGVIRLGRTSNIDTSSLELKSKRSLIFEGNE